MKTISTNLRAHLASEVATLATCWRIVLRDSTALTFTDHDYDIVYGGETYAAATGYVATDVQDTDALNVDNMDVQGIITSPSITEEDLRIGKWDHAAFSIFQVNYRDLSQGALTLKTGTLGEVVLERNQFRAELRGLTQAYTRTIGELDSPTCRADLGDARCGVTLASLTVTGTIDSVNADGVTLYDSARTEDGPTGGQTITNATAGSNGYVYVAVANANQHFAFGDIVTISGVVGNGVIDIAWINATHRIVEVPDVTQVKIEHAQDPWYLTGSIGYSSGGAITPMVDSGFFDGGVITFTAGANAGLSMEVKSYVPGQISLHLPMPYAVAAGDEYSMVAGCDKSLATCRDRFGNVINFRGAPYLPGIDSVLQTGR